MRLARVVAFEQFILSKSNFKLYRHRQERGRGGGGGGVDFQRATLYTAGHILINL